MARKKIVKEDKKKSLKGKYLPLGEYTELTYSDGSKGYKKRLRVKGDSTTRTFKSLNDLLDFFMNRDTQISPQKKMTLNELMEIYFAYKTDIKESTLKTYRSNFKHIENGLAKKRIDKISIEDINMVLKKLTDKGLSEPPKNIKQNIESSFNYARDVLDIDIKNPARFAKIPNVPKKNDNSRILDKEEMKIFYDEVNNFCGTSYKDLRFRLCIRILTITGLRIGELLGLKWEDLDTSYKRFTICRSISPSTKDHVTTTKNGEIRYAYLPDYLIKEMDDLKQVQGLYIKKAIFIFETPPNSINENNINKHFYTRTYDRKFNQYKKHLEKVLGISLKGFTTHKIRNSIATIAEAEGLTELEIGRFLGHTSSTVTGRYYIKNQEASCKKVLELLCSFM